MLNKFNQIYKLQKLSKYMKKKNQRIFSILILSILILFFTSCAESKKAYFKDDYFREYK